MELIVEQLGRMSYAAAYARQVEAHAQVVERRRPPTVFVVEHDPVVTVSRRPTAQRHVLATETTLARAGVALAETDRGGDVTYHGPGQLVVYPIVPLNDLRLNVRQYVRLLEQSVIDALDGYGVQGERDACAIGVWVGGAKVAAVGIRVKRWVTMHGLALNVTTRLEHFDLIVPCGLKGRPVTSLRRLLGDQCPTLQRAGDDVLRNFRRLLGGP